MLSLDDFRSGVNGICVVGLGYVGLPLAVALSKSFSVTGFDINEKRIEELKAGYDRTREVSGDILKAAAIKYSSNPGCIADCSVVIVTVPTPIDSHNLPDLGPVRSASELVGRNLSKGAVVVYESTVYPGLTEEFCVPVLEMMSGGKWKEDFFIGYSPERVNPGDKERSIEKITKIVAGDTEETADLLCGLYGEVIEAGIHRAADIKTAEAAKVIENTQRDINIALMNELSQLFDVLNIDTTSVLEAAGTKWNFLPFRPGLVGGHCIGVDPYYLTWKAEEAGFSPRIILSGRKMNDSMGKFIAEKAVKLQISLAKQIHGSRTLICGITFKENCPDIRNTRVVDIRKELFEYGVNVDVYDPVADADEVKGEYGFALVNGIDRKYDSVIIAVKHDVFKDELTPERIGEVLDHDGVLIDVKSMFNKDMMPEGVKFWRL
ncbi:nucleotide sugar dehydrogenase [Limisalsivibrio acetivorans]|uniref:nucleotide sugar dehydrogenase n=1 Tax=Limisalsivibrio acetivorans TaxID=1304888 RepID=UPI0003B36267|nr:nucleotide sugar dehydrogenase [Limisalsivibrio acetivorans]